MSNSTVQLDTSNVCEDCRRITAPESGLFLAIDPPRPPTSIASGILGGTTGSPSLPPSLCYRNIWEERRNNVVPEGEDPAVGPVSIQLKSSYASLLLSAVRCPCCEFFSYYVERSSVKVQPDVPFRLARVRPTRKVYESLADGDCIELYQEGNSEPLEKFNICTRGKSHSTWLPELS